MSSRTENCLFILYSPNNLNLSALIYLMKAVVIRLVIPMQNVRQKIYVKYNLKHDFGFPRLRRCFASGHYD
jgi:hypothetical protein